jgi:hypothetical protein
VPPDTVESVPGAAPSLVFVPLAVDEAEVALGSVLLDVSVLAELKLVPLVGLSGRELGLPPVLELDGATAEPDDGEPEVLLLSCELKSVSIAPSIVEPQATKAPLTTMRHEVRKEVGARERASNIGGR